MLSEFADPRQAPEVLRVREQVRSWRFYDHIRTDAAAPARASRIGTRTPVMSHDGSDVAAALQTIRETGDAGALDEAVDLAFPGSRIAVESEGEGRCGHRGQHHRANQGLRRNPRARPGAARRAGLALAETITKRLPPSALPVLHQRHW
jgi:predicted ATPase